MKNRYIIDGKITHVVLRENETEYFETLIDTEDLQKMIDFKYSWFPAYLQSPKDWYAHCTEYIAIDEHTHTSRTIGLQCFVLGLEVNDNCHVDHINHNSLDNRKQNLRITTWKNNLRHRGSINCNNTTGYRNVCFINGKYVVQLQVDGKNKVLGRFEDIDDAVVCAETMRQKYYGDFSGVAK